MKNYALVLLLCFITACHPRINSRGNGHVEENFNSFIVGKTTMDDVLEKCGPPSLHRDNHCWIYVGFKIEEDTFKNVKLIHESTVRMIFDSNNVLKSIEKIDPTSKTAVLMDEEITKLMSDAQAKKKVKEALHQNRP
jgi:outer membrane protein assembly factor BamE (lipoprotein component of BamABCDE complex)